MTKSENILVAAKGSFVIQFSSFFRHSTFVICHF